MTLVNSLENNFEQPNTRVAEPFPLCLERPLGAVVSQSGTQFAIWAPTAEKITLRLFSRGSKGEDGDALIGQFLMRPEPMAPGLTILPIINTAYITIF